MCQKERLKRLKKERLKKEVKVGGDRKRGDWAKFNKRRGDRQYKGFFINYGG